MEHVADPAPDAQDPEAFTDVTPEALPVSVPASNARPPNRKPRIRRQYKRWETRQAKKVFLLTIGSVTTLRSPLSGLACTQPPYRGGRKSIRHSMLTFRTREVHGISYIERRCNA